MLTVNEKAELWDLMVSYERMFADGGASLIMPRPATIERWYEAQDITRKMIRAALSQTWADHSFKPCTHISPECVTNCVEAYLNLEDDADVQDR